MTKYVIRNWFNGAVGKDLQTVDNILPRMALTLMQPDHREAFQRSCYYNVVKEIHRLIEAKEITDDHVITILGTEHSCIHGVIIKDGKVVYDSADPKKQNIYDPGTQIYRYANGCEIKVLKAVNFSDFKREYIERLNVHPDQSGGPNGFTPK